MSNPNLKPINFFTSDCEGKKMLDHCWALGLPYDNTARLLEEVGFLIPQEQWDRYKAVLDIQIQLDFEADEVNP